VPVVQWAIEALTSRQVHPFFIAYLHLRALAIQNDEFSSIRPRWADIGKHLALPGGPPGKPYYRPWLDGQVHDRSRYWMNSNLAGSWAPSSLRQEPLNVVRTTGRTFALEPGHAQRALTHLLYGVRLPVLPFASYLYRDYGFVNRQHEPNSNDVINAFAQDFRFRENRSADEDFTTMFDDGEQESPSPLFEVYHTTANGI
jgi:hypothetical protein